MIEVVDGEVVEDVGTALVQREGLDLSEPEQVERHIEQMGADGDTRGLVDVNTKLDVCIAALEELDVVSEQIRTLGILRIKTWAQLGGMNDLEDQGKIANNDATKMRAVAAVQERERLPELIAWAQTNDQWALDTLYTKIVPWGCAHVRAGALKGAIERSGLSVQEINSRSKVSGTTLRVLMGKPPPPSAKLRGHSGERVRLHVAKKVGEVVGYTGIYPPAPPSSSRGQASRKTRERRLYGKNLPATGGWDVIHDNCLKICSAINALDAAGENVDGLWFKCDDLFRAAQEGLKGLREPR